MLSESSESVAPVTPSCYTRLADCFRSKRTIYGGSAAFCLTAGMTALFIPVRFLNACVSGNLCFLGCYAMIRHPDSSLMINQVLPERTWKRIALGSVVCALSWGLGDSVMRTKSAVGGVILLLGIGLGFATTYSDYWCLGGRVEPNGQFAPVSQQA